MKKNRFLSIIIIIIGIVSFPSGLSVQKNLASIPATATSVKPLGNSLPEFSRSSDAPKELPANLPPESIKESVTTKELPSKLTSESIKASNSAITRENQLTLMCSSEKEINIFSSLTYGEATLLTRLDKKDWGPWNIGGWFFCNRPSLSAKDYTLLAGGGTDWEYVLSVAETPNNSLLFSGGNHGKEKLNSIKFISDIGELRLNQLKIGETMQLPYLIIYESTTLTHDIDLKNSYANVLRKYTILPSKIMLETDFEFTEDVFMGKSYVCMFPVPKNFGRYIEFIDSQHFFETPRIGNTLTTDVFDNYIGKEKTLSARIWGEASPSFKFLVRIDHEEMVDHFQNKPKVFYWDLNKNFNKLYFSKYDNENPQKISAGTKWSNKAEWSIEKR